MLDHIVCNLASQVILFLCCRQLDGAKPDPGGQHTANHRARLIHNVATAGNKHHLISVLPADHEHQASGNAVQAHLDMPHIQDRLHDPQLCSPCKRSDIQDCTQWGIEAMCLQTQHAAADRQFVAHVILYTITTLCSCPLPLKPYPVDMHPLIFQLICQNLSFYLCPGDCFTCSGSKFTLAPHAPNPG